MSDQSAFTIPKEPQDVTVFLENGKSLEGVIFLEYAPAEFTVHHKIVAFLEHGNRFFPLTLKGAGKTEFIHKNNIKLVQLTGDVEQIVSLSLMHMDNITAVFQDESVLNGELMAEVPIEKARLSDCLNLPDTFLSVKAENKICYINKNSLQKVIPRSKAVNPAK